MTKNTSLAAPPYQTDLFELTIDSFDCGMRQETCALKETAKCSYSKSETLYLVTIARRIPAAYIPLVLQSVLRKILPSTNLTSLLKPFIYPNRSSTRMKYF
jgi:hypothetical protein